MSEPARGPNKDLVLHLKEDLWGAWVIARRELWANLRSPRSLVMVVLLGLIMVVAATGISGFVADNGGDGGRGEAYIIHLIAADDDLVVDDMVVYTYWTDTFGPAPGRWVLIDSGLGVSGTTDPHGLFIAPNLTVAYHIVNVKGNTSNTGPSKDTEFYYVLAVPLGVPQLGVEAVPHDVDGDGRIDDLMVHVVGTDGTSAEGVTVGVDGSRTNTTDVNGVATFTNLATGRHQVEADRGGVKGNIGQIEVTGQAADTGGFVLELEGPDEVLSLVAAIAIGILGPIYVIALCFDTISREKHTGSIDYLLVRPMGRRAVLAGKWAGVVGAIMIPITAVSLVGVAIIAWRVEQSPSADVVVGFLFFTLMLVGVFALLQMVFSTLAKTTGTAVLSGIGLWLFFFLLYGLILNIYATVTGMSNDEYIDLIARSSFLNPVSLYSLSMDSVVAGDVIGDLPNWAPTVGLVVWTLVLLVLATEIFRWRATE